MARGGETARPPRDALRTRPADIGEAPPSGELAAIFDGRQDVAELRQLTEIAARLNGR